MKRMLITGALLLSLACALPALAHATTVEPDNPVAFTQAIDTAADQVLADYVLRTSADARCEVRLVDSIARVPRLVTDGHLPMYATQPARAVPAAAWYT